MIEQHQPHQNSYSDSCTRRVAHVKNLVISRIWWKVLSAVRMTGLWLLSYNTDIPLW